MSRLLRSGAVISAMTMISRVLGLLRDMIVARYFPVDGATDAFYVAFRIPNLLRRLFAEGAFSLAFVPVLSEYKEKQDRETLKDLIDHVAGYLALILLVVTVIGVVAAPVVMWVFAPGFDSKPSARPDLAVDMLRITFPYILFISLTAFVSGILNTFHKFAIPALTPALLNVVMIAAAIWGAPYFDEPVLALAWGVFFAGLAQLLFQLPTLSRLGLLPRFRIRRAHEGVSRIMKLMVPTLFGSSVAQLNLLINTMLASFLAVGSISWLYYSDRFVELPLAIVGVALATVILPKLSSDHAKADATQFRHTMDWALRLGLLISVPATLGLMLLAKPILATVMMHGAYGWQDVQMSALSLTTYAFGLSGFILVKVLAPGFYSRQDTRTPVKIGIVSIFANMALNVVIVLPWHFSGTAGAHAGLALATALASYVNAGMLFYSLHRQQIFDPEKGWAAFLLKILLACVAMGAALWLVSPADVWWQQALVWHKVWWLLGLILLALISYFATLRLLGMPFRQMLGR
ncbi:MAG TPA: murein biosynthesis integral membrane protein MurJ [Candidatus Thiothrix moscowensis]|uniref:murein biosynthesis integral membrane protein MurJ n=1 Tax=unclassified Thiothrix TaxID=2636184 RepID=UPI0025EEA2B1|nr:MULTISPECIES: murein biosynthesis integral membrane protein MurJ [unclassified Thiothrix]HRJ52004.1 murein biosynthesis integral membrane protein MurJ [Candidatus Thiothrix moscowensis]HRJ92485.1 murein biosynthesis integral membrane protein MurJ [Candidatus Thiothrix moscowensis]